MMQWIIIFVMAILGAGWVWAQDVAKKVPENEQTIAEGKQIYIDRCLYCHGIEGAGDGPAADFLDPRPRDFTVGMYKLRSTPTGELPTDSDLFRAISFGLSGTAMPRWELTLSEKERWKVLYYIKTFSPEFEDPEFKPSEVSIPPKVPSSPESIAKGKKIYDENKCFECHGVEGRGDGSVGQMEDGWGYPIRVRNLTRGYNIKGGANPEDLVWRFTTGMNGTPMPSFIKNIKGEDQWHLANYIASIAQTKPSEGVVLKAVQTNQEIPLDIHAEIWKTLPQLNIPLAGQVIAKPRWQNHAIDLVEVRAVYNEKEIGFLIEWDDPFKDGEHDESQEVKEFENTYVKAIEEIPREPGIFRDSIAVQFPVKSQTGAKKPYFFRGDTSNPVNLWVWKSDLQLADQNPVEDSNAKGFKNAIRRQAKEDQQVQGKAEWKNGRWRLVMIRPRFTESRNDVQFEAGKMLLIAFNAWDGSNGEHGLIMSLSAWSFLYLDTPVHKSLYLYSALVVVIIIALAGLFIVYSRKRKQ